jgi:trk system potassium uptake protein TrkH
VGGRVGRCQVFFCPLEDREGAKLLRRVLQSEKLFLFSYFLGIISLGTVVLYIPVSWGGAERLHLIDALFTATSAVCVTGLITVATPSYSTVGQIMILVLIQAGGLGIITFSTIYLARPRGRISLIRHRIIRGYYLESSGLGTMAIIRRIVAVTLSFELIGTLILYRAFRSTVPEARLFVSLFHAVSAFCNAGFSLFSTNLEGYTTNAVVSLTIMTLVIFGGLGFVVLQDVAATTAVKNKHLSLHSKIVFLMTGILLVFAAGFYLVFEAGRSMADLAPGQKIVAALFQAATPRTAGFNTIPQGNLSTPSKTLTMLLMFLGGGSGSIAGGIKVNTFFIVLLMLFQGPDSRGEVTVFKRKIAGDRIFHATMFMLKALLLLFVSFLLLTISELWFAGHRVDVFSLVFETFSAFGTVGLSLGATPGLTSVGKLVLVVTMFMGRIGLLALAIPRARPYPVHLLDYPQGEVLIG